MRTQKNPNFNEQLLKMYQGWKKNSNK